jgi:hypothetical protein
MAPQNIASQIFQAVQKPAGAEPNNNNESDDA